MLQPKKQEEIQYMEKEVAIRSAMPAKGQCCILKSIPVKNNKTSDVSYYIKRSVVYFLQACNCFSTQLVRISGQA